MTTLAAHTRTPATPAGRTNTGSMHALVYHRPDSAADTGALKVVITPSNKPAT